MLKLDAYCGAGVGYKYLTNLKDVVPTRGNATWHVALTK